jgi:hypothetical protein
MARMGAAGKCVDSSCLGMSGIKPPEWEKAKDEGPIGRCRFQTTAMICAVEYVMGQDEANAVETRLVKLLCT